MSIFFFVRGKNFFHHAVKYNFSTSCTETGLSFPYLGEWKGKGRKINPFERVILPVFIERMNEKLQNQVDLVIIS